MHADRLNRFMLSIIGLFAVALGVGGLLASSGVFSHRFQHKLLLSNGFSRYVGRHGVWVWPAIAVVTLLLTLLALRWLLRLLFSTDRTSSVSIPSGKSDQAATTGVAAAGRTTMTATALSRVVASEIETYHGVASAKARVLGSPSAPTLAIEVTASRQMELRELFDRIETHAITHAREALERPDLAVKLDIAVADKALPRVLDRQIT